MNLREIAKQTLATLRAHKMRSFLTMFGIVWGIASVIILVGLGMGFSKDQKKRMETLGKDLVIIWGGRTSAQAGGLAAGRRITLTIDDARLIKSECYLVKTVSPELQRSVPEVSQYNSAARQISGVWPSFQDFRSLILSEGRLMTDDDERDSNRVVLLGWNAARQLYPGQAAVGATLIIARYPYTVDRRARREETELQLQRPGQRHALCAVFGDGARLSSPACQGRDHHQGLHLRPGHGSWRSRTRTTKRSRRFAACSDACITSSLTIKTRSSSGTRWNFPKSWRASSA